MKAKNLVSILVLTLPLCLVGPEAVKAGGSPSSTGTNGSLKGVVKFEGTPPKPRPISMSADPSCAKQHASAVLAQDVMTDSKGDLQNVVVFVAEGLGDRTFDPPTQPVVVEQKGCMYLPHVLAVRANQPLHLVNDDPTSHNVHPTPANNREWNKAEPPGASVDEAFAREEIAIPVKCNVQSVDAWLHRGLQTSVFRSDCQGWKLRSEQSAARYLYHQSVAREAGHLDSDHYDRSERDQGNQLCVQGNVVGCQCLAGWKAFAALFAVAVQRVEDDGIGFGRRAYLIHPDGIAFEQLVVLKEAPHEQVRGGKGPQMADLFPFLSADF
ncbi:MAG: hypothetical protein WB660_09315 [Candidatus Sulfotelmatobacter sp.]